jgi:tetratricopeptide (TPR) repeat protein
MKLASLRPRALLFAILAAGLVLSSCSPSKGPDLEPDTSQPRRYLVVGDFEGAIAAYTAVIEQHPGYEPLLNEYAEAIEKIKARADQSFDSKDYGAAEKIYALLSTDFPRFAAFKITLSFGPPLLSQRIRECQTRLSERRARQALAAGAYQNTLDSYRILPPELLRNAEVSAGLQRIMEELKRLADRAMVRKDFLAAGKGYAALGDGYPLAKQTGLSLSFPWSAAEEGIKKCRTQLTKEGLDLYRKGHLKEAVSIWRGLLKFDPENAEIRKAVETATEQLEKLKKR